MMEKLIINGDAKTPNVNFDAETGVLSIEGRLMPEHPLEYYEQLVNWVSSYSNNPRLRTTVNIYIDYFSSTSAKYFLKYFKQINLILYGVILTLTLINCSRDLPYLIVKKKKKKIDIYF